MMSPLYGCWHLLVQHKLSCRDKTTTTKQFRELVNELANSWAEAMRDFPLEDVEVDSSWDCMTAKRIAGKKVAIIPILSRWPLVCWRHSWVPARVGHVGMYRIQRPSSSLVLRVPLQPSRTAPAWVVDPMRRATGGSLTAAIRFLAWSRCHDMLPDHCFGLLRASITLDFLTQRYASTPAPSWSSAEPKCYILLQALATGDRITANLGTHRLLVPNIAVNTYTVHDPALT